MANYVALTVTKGANGNGTKSVAFPTTGSGGIYIEQISGTFTLGGVAQLSKITVPEYGLNREPVVYYSTLTVAALVTALGASYVSLSVYRGLGSSAAINIAIPVSGGNGIVIEAVSPTFVIAGATIQSVITVSRGGLRAGNRTFYSAATVATNVGITG